MINSFWGITWGAFGRAPLMIIVVLIALVLGYRSLKMMRRSSLLAGQRFAHLMRKGSSWVMICKTFLYCLGTFFFVVALLKPTWDKKEESVMQEGRDLFIALDISRSMLAQDCAPDRLSCAKEKIKQLVQSLESQRVALILFSGSAFIQCPLTSDYGAFFMFLDQVDVETISSGTTALDQALRITLDTIKTMPPKKHKLLAIFTDGEDFSTHLRQIKQEAQQENLRIFTFGVGTAEGGPIPLYNQQGAMIGHQKDAQGKVVISHLNEEMLSLLAHDAGGMYVSMTRNNEDIAAVIATLNAVEKEAIEEKKVSHFEDRYNYPLLISLLCFIVEWLL
jgi:Ca-activated chloride channel homolog